MRSLAILITIVAFATGIYFAFSSREEEEVPVIANSSEEIGEIETIAENLEVPWEIVFLPDSSLLVTERTGSLVRITGENREEIPRAVASRGEAGLLGLALHPDFLENNFLYLYETREETGGLRNRVVRYRFNIETNSLSDERIIIGNIPGAAYHDGGRIKFGPDGYLYITTGDAGNENSAQDVSSLAGKILRLHDDGSVPADNPFGTPIYSYGHRNPQGLVWDSEGKLWSTEHGRSGIQSGYDELNLIQAGGNYGWPIIEGDEVQENMITPVLHSGTRTTWAPAGIVYEDGQLFWGGLRGEALYRVRVEGNTVTNLAEFFKGEFGRIRTVVLSPDNTGLYISTSNTDGRGDAGNGDDKIIRIPFSQLR